MGRGTGFYGTIGPNYETEERSPIKPYVPPRVTFAIVEKLAESKGLAIKRSRQGIDVWKDGDGSVTAVYANLCEAYGMIYHYTQGEAL